MRRAFIWSFECRLWSFIRGFEFRHSNFAISALFAASPQGHFQRIVFCTPHRSPMRKRLLALSLFALLLTPSFSRADAFDPRQVPADAKWIIHADVDTARESKTFEAVWDRLLATGAAQGKFDQIEQFTGMNIPNDLQDLTLYGKEAGDEAGVILI